MVRVISICKKNLPEKLYDEGLLFKKLKQDKFAASFKAILASDWLVCCNSFHNKNTLFTDLLSLATGESINLKYEFHFYI